MPVLDLVVLELEQLHLQRVLLLVVLLAGHALVVRVVLAPGVDRAAVRVDQDRVVVVVLTDRVTLDVQPVDVLTDVLQHAAPYARCSARVSEERWRRTIATYRRSATLRPVWREPHRGSDVGRAAPVSGPLRRRKSTPAASHDRRSTSWFNEYRRSARLIATGARVEAPVQPAPDRGIAPDPFEASATLRRPPAAGRRLPGDGRAPPDEPALDNGAGC